MEGGPSPGAQIHGPRSAPTHGREHPSSPASPSHPVVYGQLQSCSNDWSARGIAPLLETFLHPGCRGAPTQTEEGCSEPRRGRILQLLRAGRGSVLLHRAGMARRDLGSASSQVLVFCWI